MAFTFGRARDGKKTIAAGSPPAGACSASKTMSDVPSVLFNMRSRPEVSQFVRSTAETTAERSAVGLLTLRAGAARGAMCCSAPANAGTSVSTLISAVTSYAETGRLWQCSLLCDWARREARTRLWLLLVSYMTLADS